MAGAQIGNVYGVAARGTTKPLATVTADGLNLVTVNTTERLAVNMWVDIVNIATGAVLATNRKISFISAGKDVYYEGADVAATTAHGIYPTGSYADSPSNLNGGAATGRGLNLGVKAITIDGKKERLKELDPTYYTDTLLNQLTDNDLTYALRLAESPGSI